MRTAAGALATMKAVTQAGANTTSVFCVARASKAASIEIEDGIAIRIDSCKPRSSSGCSGSTPDSGFRSRHPEALVAGGDPSVRSLSVGIKTSACGTDEALMNRPLHVYVKPGVKIANVVGSALLFAGAAWFFIQDFDWFFGLGTAMFGWFLLRSTKMLMYSGPFATVDSRGLTMIGEPASPSWDEISEIEYVVHSPGPTVRHDLVLWLRDFASFERRWRAARKPGSKAKHDHPFVLPMAVGNVPPRQLIARVEREWGHTVTARGPRASRELAR